MNARRFTPTTVWIMVFNRPCTLKFQVHGQHGRNNLILLQHVSSHGQSSTWCAWHDMPYATRVGQWHQSHLKVKLCNPATMTWMACKHSLTRSSSSLTSTATVWRFGRLRRYSSTLSMSRTWNLIDVRTVSFAKRSALQHKRNCLKEDWEAIIILSSGPPLIMRLHSSMRCDVMASSCTFRQIMSSTLAGRLVSLQLCKARQKLSQLKNGLQSPNLWIDMCKDNWKRWTVWCL